MQLHKSTPLLISSLKLQWTKDRVWNRWCSDFTNYHVINHDSMWSSGSGSLSWWEWVEAGLIC